MKPFNLEAAKRGEPVQTRDGRKARIVCFDYKYNLGEKGILVLIEDGHNELAEKCNFDGLCLSQYRARDLFMSEPDLPEGFIRHDGTRGVMAENVKNVIWRDGSQHEGCVGVFVWGEYSNNQNDVVAIEEMPAAPEGFTAYDPANPPVCGEGDKIEMGYTTPGHVTEDANHFLRDWEDHNINLSEKRTYYRVIKAAPSLDDVVEAISMLVYPKISGAMLGKPRGELNILLRQFADAIRRGKC